MDHSLNQENGATSAQLFGVELTPAIRADLLNPVNWLEGLATFARATNLAVALVDAQSRLLGECLNAKPTWRVLHAKVPPPSPSAAGVVSCLFSVAPINPCKCVDNALASGRVVMVRDRTGLVHFAVPLVLGEHLLGALVAGQVFDQFAEQAPLEQVARQLGLPPSHAWELARLEHPVKRATLEVYADLLAILGRTFLQKRYHTLLAAERQAQERTAEANAIRARLLKQVMSAREVEQRRIARDLHDGVGQSITSLLLGLCVAAEASTLDETRARLAELRGITALLMEEVRRLARGLRPSALDDLGLAAALERYAADYTQAHDITVDVVTPDLAFVRLPADVETALYRIAQEALTNVLKHAAAKAVSLVVWRELGDAPRVHLMVEDDGCGFDSAARLLANGTGKGLGLLDIRERASLLHGYVTIESRPGSGTEIHVCIPLS